MEDISRRNFLTKVIYGISCITGLAFLAPIARYMMPIASKVQENVLTNVNGEPIHEGDVKEGGSVVGLSKDGPTIVVRRGGRLHALSASCTHLGCLVKWIPAEDIFFCPCHAGKFDANGVNISGPPPSPLLVYKVSVTNDGRIVLG